MTLTRTPAPPAAPYTVQLCVACHEPWSGHLNLVRDSLHTGNELTVAQLSDAVDHSVCVTLLQLKHIGPPGPPGPMGPMGLSDAVVNSGRWETQVVEDDARNPISVTKFQPQEIDDRLRDNALLTAITKGTTT